MSNLRLNPLTNSDNLGDYMHPSTSLHLHLAAVPEMGRVEVDNITPNLVAIASLFADFDELPFGMALEPTRDPTVLSHRGREVLNFGTNNYLGTTHNPIVCEATKQAVDLYGVGSTASRLAGGTNSLHLKIETQLSKMFGKPSGMIFATGFGANYALLSVIGRKDCRFFIDEECHASLYEGARKSSAKVIRFRHNSADHLGDLLMRYSQRDGQNIVVVDGLYSMSGTLAPLNEILAIREKVPFTILVDEAHSFGTLGPNGLGAADQMGCLKDIDIVTGTFSKSVGSVGGFACFASETIEILRIASPSYMYTAAIPPVNLAAISKALEVAILGGYDLRQALHRNCLRVNIALDKLVGARAKTPGPVFSIDLGSPQRAVAAWKCLLDSGIYVNLILPPASPQKTSLLRFGMSAAHKSEQIDVLLDLLSAHFPVPSQMF